MDSVPVQLPASPRLRSLLESFDNSRSFGDRLADSIAATMGSWSFVIIQTAILIAWIVLNLIGVIKPWDPFPFILLNLALSFQAAYSAPIIMMSQNRLSARDRLQAQMDFDINNQAEKEIEDIMGHLEAQDRMLKEILAKLDSAPKGG